MSRQEGDWNDDWRTCCCVAGPWHQWWNGSKTILITSILFDHQMITV